MHVDGLLLPIVQGTASQTGQTAPEVEGPLDPRPPRRHLQIPGIQLLRPSTYRSFSHKPRRTKWIASGYPCSRGDPRSNHATDCGKSHNSSGCDAVGARQSEVDIRAKLRCLLIPLLWRKVWSLTRITKQPGVCLTQLPHLAHPPSFSSPSSPSPNTA